MDINKRKMEDARATNKQILEDAPSSW